MNFGMAIPKMRCQPTLNSQVIQLKIDRRDVAGKVPADIIHAHIQTRYAMSIALRLHHHNFLH